MKPKICFVCPMLQGHAGMLEATKPTEVVLNDYAGTGCPA